MRAPIIAACLFWPVARPENNPHPPLRHRPGREERRERQIISLIAKSSQVQPWPGDLCKISSLNWISYIIKTKSMNGREGSIVDIKQIFSELGISHGLNRWREHWVFFPDYSPFPFIGVNIRMIIFQKFLHTPRISEEQRELIFNQFIICWQSLCIPRKNVKIFCQYIIFMICLYISLLGLKTRRSKLVWWTRCRELLGWPGERSKSGDHRGGLVSWHSDLQNKHIRRRNKNTREMLTFGLKTRQLNWMLANTMWIMANNSKPNVLLTINDCCTMLSMF